MEKSVLLEKQKKTHWIAMAGLFTINGVMLMFGNDLKTFRFTLGITMIILSILYVVYSIIAYSDKSKYSAKIRVTDELIEFKTSFWKPLMKLKWKDIQQIQLGNYQVDFELTDGKTSVIYDTSAERSIQLKRLLRETAMIRDVEVVGG